MANHSDSKSAFESWIRNKGGARCVSVCKDEGGKSLTEACGNGGWGGTSFFIKPDKSFKKYSSSDISSNGIREHNCNNGDILAPTVQINSPSVGEVLKSNVDYNITWKATDNIGVVSRKILFSKDNGSKWEAIDSASGNTGTFTWTVPEIDSKECKIKIYAYDKAGNRGQKESGVFSIEPVSSIELSDMKQFDLISVHRTINGYFIYVPHSGVSRLAIFDVKGKKVFDQVTSMDKQYYPLPKDQLSGMYFLRITSEKKTINKKVWFIK